MKPEKQDNGYERFVDFFIESLSIAILILGAVMVGLNWHGWEGPSVSSVLLLLTGAVLFAGHNICLYLADCSSDVTEGLGEVREAVDKLEQAVGKNKDEPVGK